MEKIKLLLIEDNRLLREGLAGMLKKQPDVEVVDTVGDSENIFKLVHRFKPEIILLDLGLRNRSNHHTVKLVKKKFSTFKIIMMDLIPSQGNVFEFVQAGVSGFILKDATVNDFLKTIRSVAEGFQVLPSHLTASLFSQIVEHAVDRSNTSAIMDSVRMTKREKEVIGWLAQGLSNIEIAQKMHISAFTIKGHIHNIMEKLALHTRLEVANYSYTGDTLKVIARNISKLNS